MNTAPKHGRRRSRRLASLIVLIATLTLSACGGSSSGGDSNEITIVGSTWIGNAPAWVGMEKGMFEDAGFDVEYRSVTASGDRLKAIASGDVQLASVGEPAMLSSIAQGDESFFWAGSQDVAFGVEGIIGQPDIASLADLEGGTLGVPIGSTTYVTASLLLEAAGLDIEDDVRVVNIALEDTFTSFINDDVDAVATFDPYYSQILSEDADANVLGSDKDTVLYERYRQMSGPDCLVINAGLVDESPERAAELIRAYFKAVEYIERHPDEAASIIAEQTKQPLPVIKETMKKFSWNTLEDQEQVMNDLYEQIDVVLPVLQDIDVVTSDPEYEDRVWLDYTEAG